MHILFIHVGVQYKSDQSLALISCHAYASPVYTHLQTAIELLSVTQNEENHVSFSRKEGGKLGGVSSFTMLGIDTSTPYCLKLFVKSLNLLI